jgi:hypothetical protein
VVGIDVARDRRRAPGGDDLDPPHLAVGERDVAPQLEPECVDLELECAILVACRDGDATDLRDVQLAGHSGSFSFIGCHSSDLARRGGSSVAGFDVAEFVRYHRDLHEHPAYESSADRGSNRPGLREVAGVDLVETRKVTEVGEMHEARHDVGERAVVLPEQRGDVTECLFCLLID